MRLEGLQRAFATALTDARTVGTLLPELVDGDGRAAERVALYRGNVVAAWQKSLANAYPVVRALVGDEFFDALARVYGHAHPSASGDLNRFGEALAAFVAGFEPTRELPYLPDVAALEWLAHRAHYATDAQPLPRARLAALQPHELLASRFALHPACGWLRSPFPVATIWRAHQPDSGVNLPDDLDAPECALVVRPRWRVDVVIASEAELCALAALREDAALEQAIVAALAADAAFDLPEMLVRWLDLGVIVAMSARDA